MLIHYWSENTLKSLNKYQKFGIGATKYKIFLEIIIYQTKIFEIMFTDDTNYELGKKISIYSTI